MFLGKVVVTTVHSIVFFSKTKFNDLQIYIKKNLWTALDKKNAMKKFTNEFSLIYREEFDVVDITWFLKGMDERSLKTAVTFLV